MRLDAIVIGAGPAGSAVAMRLARGGWSVALVEKALFPRRKVCGEFISAHTLSLLEQAGVDPAVLGDGGPEVREVAVFAGEVVASAAMPQAHGRLPYGRALRRERLDTAMLGTARAAGAAVYQPCRVTSCERHRDRFVCTIEHEREAGAEELTAPIVVAAHGSWDAGGLPFPQARSRRRGDLLAFKAHFACASLPPGRMPLVAFSGGYGGLVHSDAHHVSFSCCIRRDALAQCRSRAPGMSGGEAVFAHAVRECRGLRAALDGASRTDRWLAAGPLAPGIRSLCRDGYFAVGNAIGEAHPIVAEGISMAVQSGWLLADRLLRASPHPDLQRLNELAADYEAAYAANFRGRIRAASVFAALAVRPRAAVTTARALAAIPSLFAIGTRVAGKVRPLAVGG